MPQARKKRVALVDDHELFREAISSHLISNSDLQIEIVIEAGNGKDFCNKRIALEKEIDLVILDLNMPVMDGIETLKWIKQNSKSKVLILTMHEDPIKVTECMKEGANGYLTKDVSTKKFIEVVDTILRNGYYYNDFITKSLIERAKQVDFLPNSSSGQVMLVTKILTQREKEVLRWFASDLGYRDIAERMKISLRTFETFRDSLFAKLDAKTRAAAVVNAMKYGVLNLNEV